MDEEVIKDIATVKEKIANIANAMMDIKGYLVSNASSNVETASKLAVIASKQDDMKAYQLKCDSERSDHEKRLAEHDNRIEKCESFQGRQIKVAVVGAGVVSFLTYGGSKVIEKLMGVFQ